MSYRLLKINAPYDSYVQKFNGFHLEDHGYQKFKNIVEQDAFFFAGSWSYYLNEMGYDAEEIYPNIKPLQTMWAAENGVEFEPETWQFQIALEQIKAHKPEVVWSIGWNMRLLQAIRSEVPSVKLILGWIGSALPKLNNWNVCDVILTCAPETVEHLTHLGFHVSHLNHGFDVRTLERFGRPTDNFDISFSGFLDLKPGHHINRIKMLDTIIGMADRLRVGVFVNVTDLEKAAHVGLKANLTMTLKTFLGIGTTEQRSRWTNRRVNRKTSKRVMSHNLGEVFGIDMLRVINQSRIALNIHAVSSPTYASNLRLFESTGVGACLLTDWKDNLPELFDIDREVVTYRSAEEASDKIDYLLNHDDERAAIAEAGQRRTMRDHNLEVRAQQLDGIIRSHIYGQRKQPAL